MQGLCALVMFVGKGLCMLTKEDCRQRAPYDGDVIYNILNVWINNMPNVDDGLPTYLLSTFAGNLSVKKSNVQHQNA